MFYCLESKIVQEVIFDCLGSKIVQGVIFDCSNSNIQKNITFFLIAVLLASDVVVDAIT